ncbi:hypothetical protein GCM10017044_13950 [Kordiimonas sediminis]|uniref:Alpha-L-glutamate ligase-related protein ATP-grasp domain-containing protein n=2 Tax=Kordiimonas sediminis TaxID=1735581 RepID=A0A919ASS0_9PROT|nr:hypothetical protein GCM10017044_13950 [Kordiimonas sediminis]
MIRVPREFKHGFYGDVIRCFKGAIWYGALPADYYNYALHSSPHPHGLYSRRIETKGMFDLLNSAARDERNTLADKEQFSIVCQKYQIPTARILAVAGPDRHVKDLPKRDIFIKPAEGSKGEDTISLQYNEENNSYFDNRFKVPLSTQAAIQQTNDIAQRKKILIQTLVSNSSEIAPISPGGLATARIYTVKTVEGDYRLTNALLRLSGASTNITDNFNNQLASNDGNMASCIDIETGKLSAAIVNNCHNISKNKYRPHHPETGAQIEGITLPWWTDIKRLCLRAHEQAFKKFVFIGWDVALTDKGPVLIEGNWNPGITFIQRIEERPYGGCPLENLLNKQFEAILSQKPPIHGII